MPRLEVLPFADEHLEDASTLLAARHARHREAEPLLPSRYEATEPAREELAAVWNAEGVSGAIAFSNGKAVGYLIGAPRSAEEWGENVWVELAGHAVENAEDIRDLWLGHRRCADGRIARRRRTGRLRVDGHRLASDESPGFTVLAEAGLPARVLPALPLDPVVNQARRAAGPERTARAEDPRRRGLRSPPARRT